MKSELAVAEELDRLRKIRSNEPDLKDYSHIDSEIKKLEWVLEEEFFE